MNPNNKDTNAFNRYREVSDTNLTSEQFNKILCPNLRVGVRMGFLNPDHEGWVLTSEVKNFLEYIGIEPDSYIEKALIKSGENASKTRKPGYINITGFKHSRIDHGSSSGILNNPQGFSEKRLDLLKSLGANDEKMKKLDFARAAKLFNAEPVNFKSTRGTIIQSLEFSSLLKLYGRRDTNGCPYFEMEDIDDLWKNSRFPEKFQSSKISNYGTLATLKDMASLIVSRFFVRAPRKGEKTIAHNS